MKATKTGKAFIKQGVKKPSTSKHVVTKVAGTVSFSSEELSSKKSVSKSRERYISDVSSTAMKVISF